MPFGSTARKEPQEVRVSPRPESSGFSHGRFNESSHMVEGFAQKNYQEEKSPFWPTSSSSFISQLLDRGIIDAIDLFFAKQMDQEHQIKTHFFLWIFLLKAAKEGHVGIQLQPYFLPDPFSVFKCENSEWSKEGQVELLEKLEEDALQFISKSTEIQSPWITFEKGCLFLTQNKKVEDRLWQLIEQLEQRMPTQQLIVDSFDASLSEEQKKAIECAFKHTLSILTGGPGVGKTYTAAKLVEIYSEKYPDAKIALVAPTGKAAANLSSAFSKMASSHLEVLTLHKLLASKIYSFLPYDLLLLDECSMVDLYRMQQLLEVLKPGSRCVLLGDPDQLPPIEIGAVFVDLVAKVRSISTLSTCLRVEKKEWIEAAHDVRMGYSEPFYSFLQKQKAFHDLAHQSVEEVYLMLERQIREHWDFSSPHHLLSSLTRYMILSPMKKGPLGVCALNDRFQPIFESSNYFPLLITVNDTELELANGDMGVMDCEYAFFPLRYEGQSFQDSVLKVRKIPKAYLPHFELGFCLSIHKSQGSEYDHISVVLPVGSEVFGRKLLYTGLTRAKKSFEIYGDLPTLQKLISFNTKRFSKVQFQMEQNE